MGRHVSVPHSVTLDGPVERSVAMLMYFPTLRHGGVELRTISKLACAEILSDFADALPDVVPAEAKRAAFRADSSERHVNVRVFRVVVRNRHPFERSSEIRLHPRQQIARQPFQIGSIAKFRRYDYLPKAFIAGPLPTFESLSDLN